MTPITNYLKKSKELAGSKIKQPLTNLWRTKKENLMANQKQSFFQRLTKRQWSYFYAGVVFTLAQIIFILAVWEHKVATGKVPGLFPISVTTDLGKMFRTLEVFINNIFGFHSELYGNYASINGQLVSDTSGVFFPGIGWPIVGMILGGFLVTVMEKESRTWAYYSKKALIVSFIGGAFFSYGTRLAGGCTLTHLMGGVPVMGIRSTGSIIFMALGGATGFMVMEKLGLANYFKHQETFAYVSNADAGEQATYKKGYSWKKNPAFWLGLTFSALFVGAAVWGALGNPAALQHINPATGELAAYGGGPSDKGWLFVILTLLAGTVAGVALAKSGFGTECALVSVEVAGAMTKDDKKFAKMGVPKITRTLMRSYNPIIGVTTSWILLTAFLLLMWVATGVSPELGSGVKKGLTAGNFLGGFSLGLGAVTLIGCEIRSYMRIGMGYLNTMIGFIGFAVGYLPYTLFPHAHKEFLKKTMIFGEGGALGESKEWYSLLSDNPAMQQFIMLLWLQGLILVWVYFVKKGSQNVGITTDDLLHKNTEDIQVTIEEIAGDATEINGVTVPSTVPKEALV